MFPIRVLFTGIQPLAADFGPRQVLHQQAASQPAGRRAAGHANAHKGGQLFGLAEPAFQCAGQAVAFQRHDALPAFFRTHLVNGDRQIAFAEQLGQRHAF